MNEDLEMIKRLEGVRAQHRRIDEQIKTAALDEFTLKKLQKVKLSLRDEMMSLSQLVYPDIIA